MSDLQSSLDLLNSTHDFPCPVMIKVIGANQDLFVERVVAVVREQLELSFDPPFSTREAVGGRHVSVTLEPSFASAEEVIALYGQIRHIHGVVMVM